jgi:hypothetical protein
LICINQTAVYSEHKRVQRGRNCENTRATTLLYIFQKVKVNWQKKVQTNKFLQTMPSKKITTLFIITLHIFGHFARTFKTQALQSFSNRLFWVSHDLCSTPGRQEKSITPLEPQNVKLLSWSFDQNFTHISIRSAHSAFHLQVTCDYTFVYISESESQLTKEGPNQ